MNSVADRPRASAASRSAISGPTAIGRRRPGRALHRRAAAGRSAAPGPAAPGQPLPPVGELALQHLARQPAPLPDGEVRVLHRQLRQRRRPPSAEGRDRAAETSRTSTPIDQPSLTMWCIATSSTCSRSPRRQSTARNSGPRARSKGRCASASRAAASAASRSASGSADRSTTGSEKPRRRHGSPARARPPSLREDRAQHLVPAHHLAQRPLQHATSTARREPAARSACCTATSPGSSWSMNQSRCWANDSGRSPARGHRHDRRRRHSARRRAAPPRSARPAPPRSAPRTARAGPAPPRTRSRNCEITCVASSEWPPRSKKLSSTPTRSTPRTSLQIPASISSTGVRGATYPPPPPRPADSGAGSAARSTLPLAVSGSASSTTNADGTMYSGRRLPSELPQLAQRRTPPAPAPRKPPAACPRRPRAPPPPPRAPERLDAAPTRSLPARCGSPAP